MPSNQILKELKSKQNPLKAKILERFFKTGKGEYGEGDLFFGITVPESRKIAKKYKEIAFTEIEKVLNSKYHEARLVAILILVAKYRDASKQKNVIEQKKVYNFYLKHTKNINNWDLVDLSAHYIVGDFLYHNKNKDNEIIEITILEKLAKSKNLWERRIAIISTFAFIYKGEYQDTIKITKMLMNDKHDLINKACGWMLREIGKRVSEVPLIKFLDEYGTKIPRTMLRYAIERLPDEKRLYYLKK
jgi:3-methyladenine DNA glycosylase AlkD